MNIPKCPTKKGIFRNAVSALSCTAKFSKHAEERMHERGISREAISLVLDIATPIWETDDGIVMRILPNDMIVYLNREFQSFRNPSIMLMPRVQRNWERLNEAVSIQVVVSEDRQTIITVYPNN